MNSPAIALIPLFLGQALQPAAIPVRRQRILTIANGVALVAVFGLGLIVIPGFGAIGGSWAAVAGESLLVFVLVVGAMVVEPQWLPSIGTASKLLLSGALGVLCAVFLPVRGDVVKTGTALSVFLVASLLLRAIHPELLRLLRPGGRGRI